MFSNDLEQFVADQYTDQCNFRLGAQKNGVNRSTSTAAAVGVPYRSTTYTDRRGLHRREGGNMEPKYKWAIPTRDSKFKIGDPYMPSAQASYLNTDSTLKPVSPPQSPR
jgi:hypothetical protein